MKLQKRYPEGAKSAGVRARFLYDMVSSFRVRTNGKFVTKMYSDRLKVHSSTGSLQNLAIYVSILNMAIHERVS